MIIGNVFRCFFVFSTVVMNMSACSGNGGAPILPVDVTGIVKRLYVTMPQFQGRDIYYTESRSKTIKTQNYGKLTRREILTIFPKKYFYAAPDGKLTLFDLDMADSDVRSTLLEDASTDSYGYILGKIGLHNSPWSVLVIGEGDDYYPRSVVAYPISSAGKVFPGVEISNWLADDLEDLSVRSQIKYTNDLSITTTIVQTTYKDIPPELQKREIVESNKVTVVSWRFDFNKGFVKVP